MVALDVLGLALVHLHKASQFSNHFQDTVLLCIILDLSCWLLNTCASYPACKGQERNSPCAPLRWSAGFPTFQRTITFSDLAVDVQLSVQQHAVLRPHALGLPLQVQHLPVQLPVKLPLHRLLLISVLVAPLFLLIRPPAPGPGHTGIRPLLSR